MQHPLGRTQISVDVRRIVPKCTSKVIRNQQKCLTLKWKIRIPCQKVTLQSLRTVRVLFAIKCGQNYPKIHDFRSSLLEGDKLFQQKTIENHQGPPVIFTDWALWTYCFFLLGNKKPLWRCLIGNLTPKKPWKTNNKNNNSGLES